MKQKIRVRYAPSPTGHLHIGNARTALFNYLFARHYGGKFIIRIEDTDLKRNVEGGVENQLTFLSWLDVDWDESVDIGGIYGPYRQTERLEIYIEHAQKLLDNGLAYRCFCTEEELEYEREQQTLRGETPVYSGKCRNLSDEVISLLLYEGNGYSIRFKVPKDKSYSFVDLVKGEISFESNLIGDFVIIKKDGIPTYNFAVVVDDYLMEISHVLRGEDHISNTPRQLMIYEAFAWIPPSFGHMTLIIKENRKKLSKRDNSVIQFIEQYRNLGYLPEAMFNFIALLGWSPSEGNEILCREDLIKHFDVTRLSKSPALFDKDKLKWLNNYYIKNADLGRLTELALPFLKQAGRIPDTVSPSIKKWVEDLVALFREQMTSLSEIVALSDPFFVEKIEIRDEALKVILAEPYVSTIVTSLISKVEIATNLTPAVYQTILKEVQKDLGYKGKQLFLPIRLILTGQEHGRDLNHTMYLLGQQRILGRLKTYRKCLEE